MSEDENFLSRWSRRKQEVTKKEEAKPQRQPELGQEDSKPAAQEACDAEAVDVSKLPSLDEIAAETDISGFLQKGVPTDLARAALRRAWTSDPAIRDYVGLQENDWVFNKPGPEQGFGPLGPETDVGKLLAQVFGESPKDAPTSASDQGASTPPQTLGPSTEAVAADDNPDPAAVAQNDASHNERANKPGVAHGGALPRPISDS